MASWNASGSENFAYLWLPIDFTNCCEHKWAYISSKIIAYTVKVQKWTVKIKIFKKGKKKENSDFLTNTGQKDLLSKSIPPKNCDGYNFLWSFQFFYTSLEIQKHQ